ncbi:MAG TPA: DUF6701 domain-containing protein [Noviherbaspirillum sp.]|jgi:hypothetical protein|uniref:DUF6701 domain-containing protein n=1 Tax=Noviherbaspirillum sp. TaxID=1926288 RepID=UPI002F938608
MKNMKISIGLSFLLLLLSLLIAGRPAHADTPVALLESFAGNVNFTGTQQTLRTRTNNNDACRLVANATSSNGSNATSADLAVPGGATILKAYLYWAGSGTSADYNVTFNGSAVSAPANRRYTSNTGGGRVFFSGVADVTAEVEERRSGTYSFANLTVNNGDTWCDNSTVLGGWALLVIYSLPTETFRVLNLYEGFQNYSDSSITLDVSNFRTPNPLGNATGKHGHITWEGDPDIGGGAEPESLSFNGVVLTDALNPVNNQFNSASNINGDNASYGIDFDAYTLNSTHMSGGQTTARTIYRTSQDLVLLSAEIVAVPNVPTADLELSLVRNGPLTAGSATTYTVTVTNNGPNNEPGPITVAPEGSWPSSLTLAGAAGSGWTCGGTGCSYNGNLAPGAVTPPLTLTVNVASGASGSATIAARATGSRFDNVQANNVASDSTTIIQPPHHIRIEHDGTGQTCMPETVTIRACANASCSTPYTGTVTTTLSPSGWNSNPITFSGGSTTATLSIPTARNITLGASATSPTPAAATRCFRGGTESCSMSFTACAPSICGSGAINGTINTYYPVTQSLAAGASTVTLGASAGSSTQLASGDLVLIMQMQDATITTSDTSSYGVVSQSGAGKYEYATVTWVAGNTVKLDGGLVNAYTVQNGSNSVAQKTVQLIRVPTYSSGTLGAGLTAMAWNGSTGGVLAFDVAGTLNLNGATVNLAGKGFRGGGGRTLGGGSGSNDDYRTLATNNANGSKGEGIAGTPRYVNDAGALQNTGVEGYPNGSYARGAPANAGGGGTDDNPGSNDENTGGGGGGNGGAGGIGGYGWNAAISPGRGIGGRAVTGLGASLLTMGGGGGAGSSNNGSGTPGSGFASSGAAGGGIIMLRAGSLAGTGTFNVSGAAANTTVGNDGSGGGGAAGAALVLAGGGTSGLNVIANGGNGGRNSGDGSAHGPGGGGGGGLVLASGGLAGCNVAGGSAGTTANNNTYGSGGGSAGSCGTGLTAEQIVGAPFGAGACASALRHYGISHSGSGLTCEAEPVVITAHDDNHGRVSANGRTITVTAAATSNGAASGTWLAAADNCSMTCFDTGGAARACGNSLTPTSGNNGVASYTFASNESGIRLCLKQSSAITQNISVSDGLTEESASEDPNLAWSNTGIRFYADGQVDQIGTPVPLIAGMPSNLSHAEQVPKAITIRALKTSETAPARCVSLLGASPATKTVQFGYQCVDPGSCQASNALEVNGTAVAGSAATPSPTSNVQVSFDANGHGSINLRYLDVGKIRLYAQAAVTDPATGSNVSIVTGASNNILVRPYTFSVTPCTTGVPCNSDPADPDIAGGGPAFAQAGDIFGATIRARAYNPADPTGYGGVTRSFGLGTANGSETVSLSHSLKGPAGGVEGTLDGTKSLLRNTFANGVASVSDLRWDEVGVIELTASLATFHGAAPVIKGSSGNVGRFIPHHFDTVTAGGMSCPAGLVCPAQFNGFVYSGQPFGTRVIARNASGATTRNYTGGFARNVSLAAWNNIGSAATAQNPSAGTLRVSGGAATVAASAFSQGEAELSETSYTLPNPYPGSVPPPGPTSIWLRATETGANSDGVTSLRGTASVEGGMSILSGRFLVENAYGSELLRLPIQGAAQYYNGSRWVRTDTDTSKIVAPTGVVFSNYRQNLTAPYVNVSGAGPATPVTTTLVGGKCPEAGCFVLAAPGAGRNGSVDIRVTSPTWLPSTTGRATFGMVKPGQVIYIREMY